LVGQKLEPIIKGKSLFETSPLLHGMRSIPLEEGGSATGDLITDKSHEPGCDGKECEPENVRTRVIYSSFFAKLTASRHTYSKGATD
jgi:hypothetical protein